MSGNVPSAIGTGLRQFSGIFSVTDISGNNLCTFSANSIVLGNTNPITYTVYGTTFNLSLRTVVVNNTFGLNVSGVAADQQNTMFRLAVNGDFAISSATDAAPAVSVNNLLIGHRAGAIWSQLLFGDTSQSTAFIFQGSGAVTAPKFQTLSGTTGPLAVSGTLSGITLLPAGYAVYLASVTITASGDPGNYNCTAIISTNGSNSKVTIIQSAGLMTMSTSGLQVYATQSSGATATIDWVMTRIA